MVRNTKVSVHRNSDCRLSKQLKIPGPSVLHSSDCGTPLPPFFTMTGGCNPPVLSFVQLSGVLFVPLIPPLQKSKIERESDEGKKKKKERERADDCFPLMN